MVKTYQFSRLGAEGPTYEDLLADWRNQCETFDEDFDTYSAIPFSVFKEIQERDAENTGLYAVCHDDGFDAVCMVNHARIPKHDGPVLRVRHILLSPTFDFGELDIAEYGGALVRILQGALALSSEGKLQARYIKLHARSPADFPFFTALQTALDGTSVFESVKMAGAWLHITKK